MNNGIKWYASRLFIVSFVLGLLVNTTNALVLYIGGNALTDQPGGVLALSIGTFVLGTAFSTLVHFFILSIASFMGAFLLGMVRKGRSQNNDVGTPTPTGAGDAAFAGFLKKFALVVVIIATLISGYQAIGVYVLLSAVSQAAGLIVLTTALTFVVGLIYAVAVVGFIGAVVTFMLGMLAAAFRGRDQAK